MSESHGFECKNSHSTNITFHGCYTAVVTPFWDEGDIRSDQIAWPS